MSKSYRFGVKHLIAYDRETLMPKGIFEVIGGVDFTREIEQLPLEGGHLNSPYAVESGAPKNSLVAKLKEYPNFLFSMFDNAEVSDNAAETSGYISAILDKVGTSVVDATTGIASVAKISGSEAKLPLGKVIVKAASATTVNVYLIGDVSDGVLPVVDELPVLAEGLTIPGSGATVDLADYGIRFTGGSGTVSMTTDDIATFDCRPINDGYTEIEVQDDTTINYFGLLLVYPKNSSGEQVIVDFPKVSSLGFGFSANMREFAEFEQTMTPLYDSDYGYLYKKTKILT